MRAVRRHASFWRLSASILLLTQLSACMTWQPVDLAGAPPPPEELTDRLRVTRADSSQVVMEYAAVRGDSITGVVDGESFEGIAFEDVLALEAYRFESGFLVIPAAVTVALLFLHFPFHDDLPPAVTSDSPGP